MDDVPELAIFSASWYPNEGGAEKQLRKVAERLSVRGWRVTVITSGPASAEVEGPRIKVRSVNRHWRRNAAQRVTGWNLFAGTLRSASVHRPPDVILASLVSAASLAGVAYGRSVGRPVVLRVGGADFSRLAVNRVRRLQASWMLSGLCGVVVNADHLTTQFKSFERRAFPPVMTIPNGVEPVALPALGIRHPGPTRVLYYTNGGAPKNDPGFLDVVRHCHGLHFRALGRTGHLPRIDNLEVKGWRADLSEDFGWADVVINTSTSEGSPNFCLQALAAGRPVVGYANAGIAELAGLYPEAVFVARHGDVRGIGQLLQHVRVLYPAGKVQSVPTMAQVSRIWDELLTRIVS